jgi:serine/threonine protein kinase
MLCIKSNLPPIPPEIYDKNGNCYEVGKEIGKGGFGTVYIVKCASGKNFACKATYIFGDIPQDASKREIEEERDKLKKEAELLDSLNHPNIVGIECYFHDDNYVYTIMELCSCSLGDHLKKYGLFSEDHAVFYIIQLLSSIYYCHQRNIIHRDIKLQNILLTNNCNTLKLADFGLSKQIPTKEERLRTDCGTMRYMAPEIIDYNNINGYSFKVDIWSTCIVFYKLIYGVFPFDARDDKLIEDRIKTIKFKFPADKKVSNEFKHCIMRILEVNPRFRPTVTQILDFPLFKMYLDKNNSQSFLKPSLSFFKTIERYEPSLNTCRKQQNTQVSFTKKRKLSEVRSTAEEVINCFSITSPHFNHNLLALTNTVYSNLGETINLAKKSLDREILKRIKPMTPVFVTKTFTLGPNYGIGYELTNGIQAMLFNDGSVMSYNQYTTNKYSYYSNLKPSGTSYNYRESIQTSGCKGIRFISCSSIMSNNMTKSSPQAPYNENSDKIYMVKFIKTAIATVIFLNTGIIQLNFDDNRKLILNHNAYTFSLIRPNGKNFNFNTTEVISSFFKLDSDNSESAEFNKVDCYHYIIRARKILNDIVKEGYFED